MEKNENSPLTIGNEFDKLKIHRRRGGTPEGRANIFQEKEKKVLTKPRRLDIIEKLRLRSSEP